VSRSRNARSCSPFATRLRLELLEDRQLLSGTPAYRDLTTFHDPAAVIAPIFKHGDGDTSAYNYDYNIPALVTTNSGSVLAFAEQRLDPHYDNEAVAIVVRRSTDGGETFSPMSTAVTADRAAGFYINGVCPIVDQDTGDIFLLYTINTSSVFVVKSSDDGLTWGAPADITSSVKITANNNPGPPGEYPDDPWTWYAVGPAHGIQLQHGDHAGRLLATADHRLIDNGIGLPPYNGVSFSHVIYSDDHGLTWHLGGGMDQTHVVNYNSNECTVVELNDGDLYMNIRMQTSDVPYRAYAKSTDGGITWNDLNWDLALPAKPVSGSLLRIDGNVLVLSTLNNAVGNQRHEMTIYLSYDEGEDWVRGRTVDFGYAGYSDMTLVGSDTLLLAYTRGRTGGELFGGSSSTNFIVTFEEIELAKINLTWLQSTAPYYFDWRFNELAPGLTAPGITSINTPLPVAQDSGPWDQKALIYSSAPVEYVAGPNGDSAVRLTHGDDEVALSQGDQAALQFDINDAYTVEIAFRTSDSDGVLIGSRPTVKNWTLSIVAGHAKFSVFDGVHTAMIISDAVVNDGTWHQLVAIHDPISRKMRLIIDGCAATSVLDTNTIARTASDPLDAIVLGAYNTLDPASQLAVDVDRVRITRSALDPSSFLLNRVVGTHLFYAGSTGWDITNDNLPGFSDDNAMASDKTAYLPGIGAATFSAVSSYTKGINGVMVDLAGMHGKLTANDFFFKVGNNNSPSVWATATAPIMVTTRSGAGSGDSDRVELTWADNAILGTWLEVVIKGNDTLGGSDTNTGLVSSYVFYYGSAVADSGAGDSGAFVTNSIDEQSARNDPHGNANQATITNVNDFDRNALVNSADQQFARAPNANSNATAPKFINIGAGGPFLPESNPPAGDSRVVSALIVAPTEQTAAADPVSAAKSGDEGIASGLEALFSTTPVALALGSPAWTVASAQPVNRAGVQTATVDEILAAHGNAEDQASRSDANLVAASPEPDDELLEALRSA
jgi:sialidase-1